MLGKSLEEIDRLSIEELLVWSYFFEWRADEVARLQEDARLRAQGMRPLRELKGFLSGWKGRSDG